MHIFIHNIAFFNLNFADAHAKTTSTGQQLDWENNSFGRTRSHLMGLIAQNDFFEALIAVLDFYFPRNKIREAVAAKGKAEIDKVLGNSLEITEFSGKLLLNFLQICFRQNGLVKPASKMLIEVYTYLKSSTAEYHKVVFDQMQKQFRCMFGIFFLLTGKTGQAQKVLLEVSSSDR